jgi:hypothetical protein
MRVKIAVITFDQGPTQIKSEPRLALHHRLTGKFSHFIRVEHDLS